MRVFFAIISLLAVMQLAQATDHFDRVFYTPEQRAELDKLRARRAVASQVRNEPIPEIVTFNGIVRRSDGKATVWVNGEPLSQTDLRNKQTITGQIDRNGHILLQTPQAGTRQVRLKVGQSAELLSGQIDESYAGQETKSAPAEKPKSAPEPKSQPQPGAQTDPKALPPELLEALRQAAARGNTGAPASPENPRPVARP